MRRAAIAFAIAAGTAPMFAQTSADHFVFQDRPRLVKCDDRPCFRFSLTAVDRNGNPVNIPTPSPGSFEVRDSDGLGPHPVFSVLSKSTSASPSRPVSDQLQYYWMVLLDTSGSMNTALADRRQTRFEAAKVALQDAVREFSDGTGHVGIVPFGSRGVAAAIRSAKFLTQPDEIRRQIDGIATPDRRANTALYSAILEALPVLSSYQGAGKQVQLVVLTDGQNDVKPSEGDDANLLGDDGLAKVQEQAARQGIQIITIGFGSRDTADFNEAALRQIAWPDAKYYHPANDAAQLGDLFKVAARELTSRIQLTVGPVRSSVSDLGGKTLTFTVSQRQANGVAIKSDTSQPFQAPAVGTPTYESQLTSAEAEAFATQPQSRVITSTNPWITRLTIVGGYGLVFAVLWFGLPRIIWPEHYAPKPPVPAEPVRPAGVTRPGGGTRRITIPGSNEPRPGPPPARTTPGAVTPPIARRPQNEPRRADDVTQRDPGRRDRNT